MNTLVISRKNVTNNAVVMFSDKEKEYTPTATERRSIQHGRAQIKSGKYISLKQLRNGLGS